MRKISAVLLAAAIVLSLTACGRGNEVTEQPEAVPSAAPQPTFEPAAEPTPTPEAAAQLPTIGETDTYWVCYATDSGGGFVEDADIPGKRTDLLLRADNTAKLRDIRYDTCLTGGMALDMTWVMEGNLISFYTEYHAEPYMQCVYENGEIIFDDCSGMACKMKPAEITEKAGSMLSPAELEGTWLQIGGVVEGWEWETEPGELHTIVIASTWGEEDVRLVAEVSSVRFYGADVSKKGGQEILLLDEPLYLGCGNDSWSVRIGAEAPKNEYGYPLGMETERYAALIDENTMLTQLFYTMDGAPAVSYQTYKRIPPHLPHWYVSEDWLKGSAWSCEEYLSDDGTVSPLPAGLDEFSVYLNSDKSCCIDAIGTEQYAASDMGTWQLDSGGVLLLDGDELISEYDYENGYWLAGAVCGVVFNDYEFGAEMYLRWQGGTMKLRLIKGGSGDTERRTALEEAAAAAPENAVLVVYGDEYLDMELYDMLPAHVVSAGDEARSVVLTAACEHIGLWITELDGEIVWSEQLEKGESIKLMLDIPEEYEQVLWMRVDGVEYWYDINAANIPLSEWYYITIE